MIDWLGPLLIVGSLTVLGYVQLRYTQALRRQQAVVDELTARGRVPFPTRPRRGACPDCGAAENEWCREHCHFIDLTDHR